MLDRRTIRSIVGHLGLHGPDGLLAFVCLLAAFALTSLGVDQWLTAGFIIVLFALYALRQTRAETHRERVLELEVEKLETQLAVFRQREAARLKKAKEKKALQDDGRK